MSALAEVMKTAPAQSLFIPSRRNAKASPQIRWGAGWSSVSPRLARRIARTRAGEGTADECLSASVGGVITPAGEVFLS